ncbi:hypothetical protein THASP1DRAFT_33593 [Thamnocephalis sphaerospora]|uniref:Peptidase M14 domain-containing protein n=1 Tax=Thamnocephalis sphaerospora TaxID=78915 RepID=A0A4P9XGB7_9FUNG|nr:hypothetical protein THASP1DRAFT_33593 [Thamnocephalis sphaerospora]|eukprot:RKP04618.1 hypothetical protein THASP1DRAFT_33593 [Thamnocephalis sphaerospora]
MYTIGYLLLFSAGAASLATAMPSQTRFNGQQVVSLSATGSDKVSTGVWNQVAGLDLDVWKNAADHLHIRVDAVERKALGLLPGMQVKTIVDDIQRLVDAKAYAPNTPSSQKSDWFSEYRQLEDIYNWLYQMARDHADIVSEPISIGETIEGRQILQLRVTAPGDASKRKRIWMQSLIHAREWISGSTLQYVFNSLVSGYNKGEQRIKNLLEKVVFNREYSVNGTVYGVDLNRNWPDHWALKSSSKNPKYAIFHGPAAASSREVQALMAAYIKEPNVVGAIDLHAYSQLILYPYGWTNATSPDDAAYKRMGQQIADNIYKQSGKTYTSQRISDMYLASGCVSDWWYGPAVEAEIKAGIPGPRPYAFGIELRPAETEKQGFIVGPEEIRPTGEEIYSALVHFSEEAEANSLPSGLISPDS